MANYGIVLLIFEIFKLQVFINYHPDYFDELENFIKSYKGLDLVDLKIFQCDLMSFYLSSSHNRFKFAQRFCKYLTKFYVK